MQNYEIRWTYVWVVWCHCLLLGTMVIAHLLRPESLVPRAEFDAASSTLVYGAKKDNNLVVVPIKLDHASETPLTLLWEFIDSMPSSLSALPNDKLGELPIRAGMDSEDLRLQFDWDKIEKPLTVELKLLASDELQLGTQNTHKLTFIPKTTITYELTKEEVREGYDTTTMLKAQLNHPIDQDLVLAVSLGTPCNLVQLPSAPYVIKAGEDSGQWPINIGNDDEATGTQSLRLLVNLKEPKYLEQQKGIFLTIVDDERLRKLALKVSSPVNALKENEQAVVEITGTLDEPADSTELVVPLVFEGTATVGEDYKASQAELVFKNSSAAKVKLSGINDGFYDPGEFLLVKPGSHPTIRFEDEAIKIPVIDESKLKLTVSPVRVLREGVPESITLTLEPNAQNLTGVTYPPIRFRLALPGADKEVLNQLKVGGAEKVSKGTDVLEYEAKWESTNKPLSFSLTYLDDKQYRGNLPCELLFAGNTYDFVDAKGQTLTKPRFLLELEDDDTVPISLSMEGKTEEVNKQSIYVLREDSPQESVKLTVKLLRSFAGAVEVPIYFIGKSNADDLVFPAGPPLKNYVAQGADRRTVRFEAGQTEVSIPILPKDDEDFEGPQTIKIRVDRDLRETDLERNNQLLLKVYDDDPVKITISKGPLEVQEGGDAEVTIQLVNAPDGVVGEIELLWEATKESTAQLTGEQKDVEIYWKGQESTPLNPALLKFPSLKNEAKLVIKALRDGQEEGSETLRLNLKVAARYGTDFYTIQEPITTLQINEVAQQSQRIMAVLVNSRLARLWPQLQPAFTSFVAQFKNQLLGKGILLVGENGKAVVWDGTSAELPVSPMVTQASEDMLATVIAAASKQEFPKNAAIRMILFWTAESTDTTVSELHIPEEMYAHIVVGLPENGQGATLLTNIESALKLKEAGSAHTIDSVSPPMRDTAIIGAIRKSFKENP